MVENLVSYDGDHLKALFRSNAVDEEVAVEADKLAERQQVEHLADVRAHMFGIEHAVFILRLM